MDNSLPWCIIGDFNELLSNDDKRGRMDHPHWKIQGFRDVVMDSHHIDIHIEGYQFTWAKGRGADDFKEELLDRGMATQFWKDSFPNHRLCNTIVDRSDHTPIVLHLFAQGRRRGGRGFKFENAWLEEEQLEAIVEKGWALGEGMDVINRVKTCTEEMNVWGRSLRMRYRADIDGCRKELENLYEDVSQAACMRYKEVQAKLTQLWHQEEAFWRQRSKVLWLKEGDSNSKFFHAAASTPKRRNEIKKLVREDGTETTTQVELEDTTREYVENLFQHAPINHESVIDAIPTLISDDDNASLMQPFVMEEFSQALAEMHKDKAPGPTV